MSELTEQELTDHKALIQDVAKIFEGDEDDPYGLSPERAKQEALSFLANYNATAGSRPIDISQPEQVLKLAKDVAIYQP